MPANPECLFISDLHLDRDKPEIGEQFIEFINTRASKAQSLYILGDLFHVWLGDDDSNKSFQPIFEAMRQLAKSVKLYFLHGNRDFLVGRKLAQKAGFTLLQEPFILQSGNHSIGLVHGDLLCSDDIDYQKFRQTVRGEQWQTEFLARPLPERRAIAAQLREKSSSEMAEKEYAIMDVNQQTVLDTFKQLNIDTLIHGHTHRPGVHHLANKKQRIVLGDWTPHASYVSLHKEQLSLIDPRL